MLITIVGLNYLYLLIVILMVKVLTISYKAYTNDVATPKNHTHAIVVFIIIAKTFMIKAYKYKMMLTRSFIDFIILVVILPDTIHPWFSLDNVMQEEVASSSVTVPSFAFASCIEFHQFYRSCHHSPDTTLGLSQIFVVQEYVDYQ